MIVEVITVTDTPQSIADLLGLPGYALTADDGSPLVFSDESGAEVVLTSAPLRSYQCKGIIVKYNDISETNTVSVTDNATAAGYKVLDGTNSIIEYRFSLGDLRHAMLYASADTEVDIIVEQ